MSVKTGLLIVSNPKQISKILIDIKNRVNSTLYIQLISTPKDSSISLPPVVEVSNISKLSRAIFCIYSQATKHCKNLDVRVLLSGFKARTSIHTNKSIDIIIFDRQYREKEISSFIENRISNISHAHHVLTLDTENNENCNDVVKDESSKLYKHVVLGGTFDRLHNAHKLLLSDAILRAEKKLTVGVTDGSMIQNKLLWELIEDTDLRVNNVLSFVKDVCHELVYDVCKISDPYGPSIIDPSMESIIVSPETVNGAIKINRIRKEKGLNELDIVGIEFIKNPNHQPKEDEKVSSSTIRLNLLGTLLKPVENIDIPKKPYIIGLTGGIASGKSGVSKHLEQLGAEIINCDAIGHQVYTKGKSTYERLIEVFGQEIIDQNGEIDRKILGGIVFSNKSEMEKLNNIVWPAIAVEVQNIIKQTINNVICIEAAVLLQAGWEKFCHEIWATMVPPNEAIKRLQNRNNLTEKQAQDRLGSQPSNAEYVKSAHVVICPFWEVEYTREQVQRAWKLLQNRLK